MTTRFWRKKINRRILSGHQGLVVWWSIGPRQTSSRTVTQLADRLAAQGKMWRSGLGIEQRVDFFAPPLLAATNMSKGRTACFDQLHRCGSSASSHRASNTP